MDAAALALVNPNYRRVPAKAAHDSLAEFYEFYLGEHANVTCRRLHVLGTTAAVACLLAAVATARPLLLLAAFVSGYGAAWAGHFFFEDNRPATFRHPAYSLACDFKLWGEVVTGKRRF